MTRELIVRETHRALWYEDGKLTRELAAGRYKYPRWSPFRRAPQIDVKLVDMRERDLTIKGQEILTADKVSLRVSILVQFRVIDARAALQEVENYEDRLYSDVQLAARRSLASMALDEILTNRNKLSEEILADVKETAAGYGVAIRRADVKDLIFPGNLQDIMNQVLAAERQSEATLIQARTNAEVERLKAESKAQIQRAEAAAETEAERLRRQMEIETDRLAAAAEAQGLEQRQKIAELLDRYPAMLRLLELEALRDVAKNSNARVYLGMDRPNGECIRLQD
jgi:regulator of protease activity HflC (stomatin/prohibitin superfamily)